MFLGIGLSVRGRGTAGRANTGLTLSAEPIRRGVLLHASPIHSEMRGWLNDPAYADRVGYYRAGGPSSMLQQKAFADLFTFSRASKAWDYDSSGLLSEHATNAIRQGYDRLTGLPAGWRIEGASTNGIRNPRAAGLTAGSAATGAAVPVPTHWNHINHTTGLTVDVSAAPVLAGMTGVRLRYHGTTSASTGTAETLEFDTRSSNATPASSAQAGSFYYRLAAGTLPAGALFASRVISLNSSLGVVDNLISSARTLDGTLRRSEQIVTLGATAASAVHGMHMQGFPVSTACDFTIDVYGPQFEANYHASSLMLPPAGTLAATSRAADSLTVDGSRFTSIFGTGAPTGFIIMDAALPRAAGAAAFPGLFQIDTGDGTNNNRIMLRNEAGTADLRAWVQVGGGAASPLSIGAFTAGTPFRVGLRWGSGAVAASLNGAAAVTLTTTLPSALALLRLGTSTAAVAGNLNGRIRLAASGVKALTDAQLVAASTANANIETAIAA